MSFVHNVNELNALVRGEQTNAFENAIVDNRIIYNGNIELLRIIENYEDEEIPFVFRNMNQDNKDEQILTWDLNGNTFKLEILKWVENRRVYIEMITNNRFRISNPGTHLFAYVFSKKVMDNFLKRNLVTYSSLTSNLIYPYFFYADLDHYAFSRTNFKPIGWPVSRNVHYVFDELDIAMMQIREFNLGILTAGQKRAFFLEYKRIKYDVCKKRLIGRKIYYSNIDCYIKFLHLALFWVNAQEYQLLEAYGKFLEYFEMTEKTSHSAEENEINEENEVNGENEENNLLIWDEISDEHLMELNEHQENEERNDVANIPFFDRENEENREEPIRIYSNIEPNDAFCISFLGKKKDRNEKEN